LGLVIESLKVKGMVVTYDYLKPSSIEEALGLLQRYRSKAVVVAGGTDVMVGIRQRKLAPEVLISLRGLNGFDRIERDGQAVRIGSLSTHRKVAESVLIRESFSALSDAACHVGSLQIRNVATIGGNISNGLPSADTACPFLIFDTQVKIKGARGERTLLLDQFFIGPGKTALQSDEILLEFVIPSLPSHSGSCYRKIARRRAMELPVLGMAMLLAVDIVNAGPLREALKREATIEDLQGALDRSEIYCREARIALGVVAPTPIRAKGAEAVLKGVRVTTETLRETGEKASREIKPRDTMRGSAWFRKEMVRVLPGRLAMTCLERILFSGRQIVDDR
jgi:carbon-monoxide dehydrogenase medium subunit